MAQSESETVLTEHHETDNLDPRTDAPARPGTPVHIAPVQLGNITVPTPVVLSPMAGVTNWPFRVICEEYGPDGLYVAEMITARALVAHNPKALRLCHFAKSEKIRSLQLYGVNPSITEQAAKIVVDGNMADHVDLNFGCPVPKVTRRGGGSALPWKTDIFTELLQRVVAVCEPAGIPVTAKIRVGIDHNHETFLEAGHIAQEEGCKAVTLHARTAAEYYGGHSDWSRIGELKEHLNIRYSAMAISGVPRMRSKWCARPAATVWPSAADARAGRGCSPTSKTPSRAIPNGSTRIWARSAA